MGREGRGVSLPEDVVNPASKQGIRDIVRSVGKRLRGTPITKPILPSFTDRPLEEREYPDQIQKDRARGIIGELKKEEGKASSTVIIGVSSGLAGLTVGGLGAYFIPKVFASENSFNSPEMNRIVDSRNAGSIGGNSLENSQAPILTTGDKAEQPTPAPAETPLPTPTEPAPTPTKENPTPTSTPISQETPPPTPTESPTAAPTPTEQAPTPTPTPTETPIPFELRMNVYPGVPAEDKQYVIDGIEAARAYMRKHFNFNYEGLLTLNVNANSTGHGASYRSIDVWVFGAWSPHPTGKRNTAAHEMGHQLSLFLTNNLGSNLWGDWWMEEGTAQYIADESLTEAGYYTQNQQEACTVASIVRNRMSENPVTAPLRRMDTSNPNLPVWSIASFAVRDFVEQYGDEALAIYWQNVRARGPEDAFLLATGGILNGDVIVGGVTLDQFASQFDLKRQNLTFPKDKYSYWETQNPCEGI